MMAPLKQASLTLCRNQTIIVIVSHWRARARSVADGTGPTAKQSKMISQASHLRIT